MGSLPQLFMRRFVGHRHKTRGSRHRYGDRNSFSIGRDEGKRKSALLQMKTAEGKVGGALESGMELSDEMRTKHVRFRPMIDKEIRGLTPSGKRSANPDCSEILVNYVVSLLAISAS